MKFDFSDEKTINTVKKIFDILFLILIVLDVVLGIISICYGAWQAGVTSLIAGPIGLFIAYVLIQIFFGIAHNVHCIKKNTEKTEKNTDIRDDEVKH